MLARRFGTTRPFPPLSPVRLWDSAWAGTDLALEWHRQRHRGAGNGEQPREYLQRTAAIDSLIVTGSTNRRYFSGWSAEDHAPDRPSGVMLVTPIAERCWQSDESALGSRRSVARRDSAAMTRLLDRSGRTRWCGSRAAATRWVRGRRVFQSSISRLSNGLAEE